MRGVLLGAVAVGLIVGGVIAGVRTATRGDAPAETPVPASPRGTPRATAEAFARAWSAGDANAMYLLLSPESQRAISFESFAAAYDSFASETTLDGLAAAVRDVDRSSASVAVHLATNYFGDFDYAVVLRLEEAPAQYLVNWDSSAIHPAMVDGRVFKSDLQRPRRGAILDRKGAPLAVTREVRMVGLDRSVIADRDLVTSALVAFGFNPAQVASAFASPIPANQRVAVGPMPDDRADAAADLVSLAGVLVYAEVQRVHPLGAAAAHVVGYTRELTAEELGARRGQGYRPGDRVGAVGLEASQDAILAGRPGGELRLVDAAGVTVERLQSLPFVEGQDVATTLDATVLLKTAERLGNRPGAAVVLDPRSNEILALNSSPSYDPDAFEHSDQAAVNAIVSAPNAPQANRATAGLYSGGSTFKLVTAAAGLVDGGYAPADRIQCSAVWNGIDPPRRNWEGSQGPLTIAEGLMRSCNPVFYEIALQLYRTTEGALSKMARAFGFGGATGVAGLAEEDGLVPDAEWKRSQRREEWFPGDEVNLGIGQGDLLITPLQLANSYSTFLARSLRSPVVLSGRTAEARGELPLTDAQFAHLRRGLELVTSASGTASAAFANAGYTNFGGKSGTAEDVGAQQHVLFVAYAPAAAPRAVGAVVLDEGQSGSIEAGPIARDIVLAALAAGE
jgi:penicillin-binding protein 2